MASRVPLEERIARDVARGDLGAARRRLASAVGAQGYQPDLLARVAALSAEMRDHVQAGRYWLLTPTNGPEVDAAIEAFVRACHRNPRQIAAELPRFSRAAGQPAYDPVVLGRLAALGVSPAVAGAAARRHQPALRDRLAMVGCTGLVMLGAILMVVGVAATLRWLFR